MGGAPQPAWSPAAAPSGAQPPAPAGQGPSGAGAPDAGGPGSASGSASADGAAPPIEKSKLSGSVYIGIAAAIVILVAVLDFIIQNLETANVHFFSAHFRLPVGILVLLGAIGGAVIVLLVCLYQFLRMRRAIHRHTHPDRKSRQGST